MNSYQFGTYTYAIVTVFFRVQEIQSSPILMLCPTCLLICNNLLRVGLFTVLQGVLFWVGFSLVCLCSLDRLIKDMSALPRVCGLVVSNV